MDTENTLLLLKSQTESDNLEEINVLRICLSKYHKDIKYQCDICKSIAFVSFGKFMDHYTTEHQVFLYIKDNNWGLMSLYKYSSAHKEVGSHNFSNLEYYKNRQPKAFVYFSNDFELRFKCNICDHHDFFNFEEVLQHFYDSHSHSFDFENEWIYLILNIKDDKCYKIDVLKDNTRRMNLKEKRGFPHNTVQSIKQVERTLNPLDIFDFDKNFGHYDEFSKERIFNQNVSVFGSRESQIGRDESTFFGNKSQSKRFLARHERRSAPYPKISGNEGMEKANRFEGSLERKPSSFSSHVQGGEIPARLLEPHMRSPPKRSMGFLRDSPQRDIFLKPHPNNSLSTSRLKKYNSSFETERVNITGKYVPTHGTGSFSGNTMSERRPERLSEDLTSYPSSISKTNKEKIDRNDMLTSERGITFGNRFTHYLSKEKIIFGDSTDHRLNENKISHVGNLSEFGGGKSYHPQIGKRETFVPNSRLYGEVSARDVEKSDRDQIISKESTQNRFSRDSSWMSDNQLSRPMAKSAQFNRYQFTKSFSNENEYNLGNRTGGKFSVSSNEISQKRGASINQAQPRITSSPNGNMTSTMVNSRFNRSKLEDEHIKGFSDDTVVRKSYDNKNMNLEGNFSDDESSRNNDQRTEILFEGVDPDIEELFPEEDDVLTVANIEYTLFTFYAFECILCTEMFKSLLQYMNHLRVSHKTIFLPDEKSIIKLYLYSEDISTARQDFKTKLETRAQVFERRTRRKAELRQELNTDHSKLPKAIQFKGDWIELGIIYFNTKTELLHFRCDVCFNSGFKSLKKFMMHVSDFHTSCLSYELVRNAGTKTGNLVLALNNITQFPLDNKTREKELKKFRQRELRRTESNLIHSRIAQRERGIPGGYHQAENQIHE